jgi:hypothetical protein
VRSSSSSGSRQCTAVLVILDLKLVCKSSKTFTEIEEIDPGELIETFGKYRDDRGIKVIINLPNYSSYNKNNTRLDLVILPLQTAKKEKENPIKESISL